nr:MAG TPA: hypothetical protein [Caudoviricetes sp.]
MPVAPLLAPGGVEMRVVSQAAAFTWGSWSVSWPEGFEPPDPPAEDRELGWVADLGGTEVEPFGRCFVRADAQIDATLGRSNVEDVLDAARYRTSGEVFLETEIPFENLAGQLPYRDFDVNGFVPVRLGGRILENQLVTKVEESEDELGNRAATTYIGGQKFQDREALRTRNREIDRVIAQERLERGDEIGARLAASKEYEREQRDELKRYIDTQDDKVSDYADDVAGTAEENAKTHAEEEDKKLKRDVNLVIGPEGSLTRQVRELNDDYTAKLGENGSVIADQAAHQRMLSGIVYGTPVTELEGTAFQAQQQAINEMNDVFRNRQTTINGGFDHLFGLNAKINLAQDYTIDYNRIMAEAYSPKRLAFSVMRDEIGGVQVGSLSNNPLFSEARYLKQGSGMFKIALIPTFATEGIFDNLLGVFSLQGEHMKDNRSFNTPVSIDDGYYSMWLPEPTTRWFVWGVVLPYSFLMLYRQRLEALKAEFRAKGLRV